MKHRSLGDGLAAIRRHIQRRETPVLLQFPRHCQRLMHFQISHTSMTSSAFISAMSRRNDDSRTMSQFWMQQRSLARAVGMTDSTKRRWQDKGPRGAATDGCGFSDGYRERLHIAPHGRSLQTRPFSNDLNCLARCAAFAPLPARNTSASCERQC
jgi:hypothetical protein